MWTCHDVNSLKLVYGGALNSPKYLPEIVVEVLEAPHKVFVSGHLG